MNTYFKNLVLTMLACSLAMGCSTSNKTPENATDTQNSPQEIKQTIQLSTIPTLGYQYQTPHFDFVVQTVGQTDVLYSAEHIYQSVYASDPKEHPVFFFKGFQDTDPPLILLDVAKDGGYEHYGISDTRFRFQDNQKETPKIYKLQGEQKEFIADAVSKIDESYSEIINNMIQKYDDSDEDYDLALEYPRDSWRHSALDVIDDNFNLKKIIYYIEKIIISEHIQFKPQENQSFFIRFDGKSQINQKDALEFTIGVAIDREKQLLTRVAFDNQNQVYLYEARPVFLANIPNQIKPPKCDIIDTDRFSGISNYYYQGLLLVVKSKDFKKGAIPMPSAAMAAADIIRAMNYQLPVTVVQNLDVDYTQYSLVTNSSVPHDDMGYNEFSFKDNITMRLDGIVSIDGSDAYDFSIGETGFSSSFNVTQKIAVAQNGKMYTYEYVPVSLGQMREIPQSDETSVYISYQDSYQCQISGIHGDYTYETVLSRSPIQTYQKDSMEEAYMDEPEEEPIEDSEDNDDNCEIIYKIADSIFSNYDRKEISNGNERLTLLFDSPFKDNSNHIRLYIGISKNNNKLKVLKSFTITESGNILLNNGKDNNTQIGNYKE